jgi:hypothetical protein
LAPAGGDSSGSDLAAGENIEIAVGMARRAARKPLLLVPPLLTSRPSGPVGKVAAAFLKRLEKSPHRHPVPGSSQSVILEAYDLSVLAVVKPPLFQIVDHIPTASRTGNPAGSCPR